MKRYLAIIDAENEFTFFRIPWPNETFEIYILRTEGAVHKLRHSSDDLALPPHTKFMNK